MITKEDLQEAIAECLGKRNPDASTCIKLAAFYTIQNELYGTSESNSLRAPSYSFAAEPTTEKTIRYDSGTEFSSLINGKDADLIMNIIDELMDTLSVVQPPLYRAVIRKLTDL